MNMMTSSTWQSEFSRILNKIIARKDSEIFREPVNWELLGIPDYPEIVKKPMDLGTVKTNLDSGKYQRKEDAVADMRLIWSNSMLYNAPGSKIYMTAKLLSEYFEGQWATFAKDDVDRPPNNEEMAAWVELCHHATEEELGKVVMVLDKDCPSCLLKRYDCNEVEVNVDLIPGKLFRELQDQVIKSFPDLPSMNKRKIRKIIDNPTTTNHSSAEMASNSTKSGSYVKKLKSEKT